MTPGKRGFACFCTTTSRVICTAVLLIVVFLPSCRQREATEKNGQAYQKSLQQLEEAMRQKDFDLALACANEAMRLAADDAALRSTAYAARAVVYDAKCDWEKVIADCSEAIRLDAGCGNAYRFRGRAYSKRKEYEKAIADYSKAISMRVSLANTYRSRGLAYFGSKRFAEAEKDFDEAIALEERKDPLTFLSRALSRMDQGNFVLAAADCTEVIKLDPDNAAAYGLRGRCYFELKQYDEAIADCTRAIDRNPKESGTHSLRGASLVMNQRYNAAIPDCTKAIQLNPEDHLAYFFRGVAHRALGNQAQADADYQESQRLAKTRHATDAP